MQKMVNGVLIDLSDQEISERNQSMPNEELAMIARAKRNKLLIQSDTYALSDRITDDWIAYRQALRDITSHANWPNLSDGDWPTKP